MENIDWKKINYNLPHQKTLEESKRRKEMFKQMDGNGNGFLSLAEIDKGVRDVLNLEEEVFHCKKAIMRAFQAAKNKYKSKSKYGPDYIELLEFRYFLIYLRQYFEYWVMFTKLDTSGDHKINFDEFKSAIPQLEAWGVKMENPRKTFDKVSKGDGNIIFDEFCTWAIQESLDLEDDEDINDPDELKGKK